jgi:hypothetical protein
MKSDENSFEKKSSIAILLSPAQLFPCPGLTLLGPARLHEARV